MRIIIHLKDNREVVYGKEWDDSNEAKHDKLLQIATQVCRGTGTYIRIYTPTGIAVFPREAIIYVEIERKKQEE